MAGVPAAKLAGVLAKQLSKPIASRLQAAAQQEGLLRRQCMRLGQALNWASVRILRSSHGRENFRSVLVDAPYFTSDATTAAGTIKAGRQVELVTPSEAEVLALQGQENRFQYARWQQAGEQCRGWISRETNGQNVLGVRPIDDEAALKRGTVFLGEALVFTVAAGVVVEEYWRKGVIEHEKKAKSEAAKAARAKEKERRAEVLQKKLAALKDEVAVLQSFCLSTAAESERIRFESKLIVIGASLPVIGMFILQLLKRPT